MFREEAKQKQNLETKFKEAEDKMLKAAREDQSLRK